MIFLVIDRSIDQRNKYSETAELTEQAASTSCGLCQDSSYYSSFMLCARQCLYIVSASISQHNVLHFLNKEQNNQPLIHAQLWRVQFLTARPYETRLSVTPTAFLIKGHCITTSISEKIAIAVGCYRSTLKKDDENFENLLEKITFQLHACSLIADNEIVLDQNRSQKSALLGFCIAMQLAIYYNSVAIIYLCVFQVVLTSHLSCLTKPLPL